MSISKNILGIPFQQVKLDNRPQGKDRIFIIYDSQIPIIKFEKQYRGNQMQATNYLFIPSSHYFYLSNTNIPIPYLSLVSNFEEFNQDLNFWINDEYQPLWVPPAEPSESPEIDLLRLLMGIRIKNLPILNRGYLRNIRETIIAYRIKGDLPFDYLRQISDDDTIYWLQKLNESPLNPNAEFFRAVRYAYKGTPTEIQNYLDEIGVVNFTANDIINETINNKIFYLTRFYGPPVPINKIEPKITRSAYLQLAKNSKTKALVPAVVNHFDQYSRYSDYFMSYFTEFNENENSEAWKDLGALSFEFFTQNPFDYLALIDRPSNLPTPPNFNTIHQLKPRSKEELKEILKNYSDIEILKLVGEIEVNSREELIRVITEFLSKTRAYLLYPSEANLCTNKNTPVTDTPFNELEIIFIGLGNIMEGMRCYEILELIEGFNANTDDDGKINFRDIYGYRRNFSLQEIKAIHRALIEGRPGIDPEPSLVEKFNFYILRYELQESGQFEKVRTFRKYGDQKLLKDVFRTYFEMGMYMRQWKGPGHPYPLLEAETGVGPERGQTPEVAEEVDFNVDRIHKLFLKLFKQLPKDLQNNFWKLGMATARTGNIEKYPHKIQRLWNAVFNERYCIRTASEPWVTTGGYYYFQIFNEDIPGYKLSNQIDFIT